MESGQTKLAPMSGSTKLLFFLLFLLHLTVRPGAAQQVMRAYTCYDSIGNYTSPSTYKSNLNALLASISSNTNISYGFFNFSSGKDPDQVYGIALCRGDLGFSDCHNCLDFVISNLTQLCPQQKEVIGWADTCMLRYSNRSIFAEWEDIPPHWEIPNGSTIGNDAQFRQVQQNLVDSVKNTAAKGDSRLKFATQEAKVNDSVSIYMLMQCTPDLSTLHCMNCFYRANSYPNMSYGGRVLLPSCNLRYELYKFYNSTDSPANAPQSSHNSSNTGKSSGSTVVIVVATVVSSTVLIVIIILLYWFLTRRRKMLKKFMIKLDKDDEIGGVQSLQYELATIKATTGNFSEANKLGHGGYGDVYKGTLFGREVAVKRLARNTGQGESEFKNEVLIVANLQHRNLVRLLGFCLEDQERVLIYEFVPNASLDYYLFDETRRIKLDWEKRYEIIVGIARGLLYLHEGSSMRIIHRDLKPGNVLLDAEMRPKIADFGTVRLFQVDQTQLDTRRIIGTHGYMAPEYALHGCFSIKSDVYSFGVLVLEIITAQRCINFQNDGETFEDLVTLVWRNWNLERALDIVDPLLVEGSEAQIMRCIHIALLCVQDTAADRPTMSSVVHMLSGHDFDLAEPYQPSYVMTSSMRADSREFESH